METPPEGGGGAPVTLVILSGPDKGRRIEVDEADVMAQMQALDDAEIEFETDGAPVEPIASEGESLGVEGEAAMPLRQHPAAEGMQASRKALEMAEAGEPRKSDAAAGFDEVPPPPPDLGTGNWKALSDAWGVRDEASGLGYAVGEALDPAMLEVGRGQAKWSWPSPMMGADDMMMPPMGPIDISGKSAYDRAAAAELEDVRKTEAGYADVPLMEDPYFWSKLGYGAITSPAVGPKAAMATAEGVAPLMTRLLRTIRQGMPQAVGEGAVAGALSADPGERLGGAAEGGLMGLGAQTVLGPLGELATSVPRHVGEEVWRRAKGNIVGGHGADLMAVERGMGEPVLFADPGESIVAGLRPGPAASDAIERARAGGGEVSYLYHAARPVAQNLMRAIDEVQSAATSHIARRKERFFATSRRTVETQPLYDALASMAEDEVKTEPRRALAQLMSELEDPAVPGQARRMTAREVDRWRGAISKAAEAGPTQPPNPAARAMNEFLSGHLQPFIQEHFLPLHYINREAGPILDARRDLMRSFNIDPDVNDLAHPTRTLSDDFASVRGAVSGFGKDDRATVAIQNLLGEIAEGDNPVGPIRRFLEERPALLEHVRAARGVEAYADMVGSRAKINQIVHEGGASAYVSGGMPTFRNRVAGARSLRGGGMSDTASAATALAATDDDVEEFLRMLLGEPTAQKEDPVAPPPLQLGQ